MASKRPVPPKPPSRWEETEAYAEAMGWRVTPNVTTKEWVFTIDFGYSTITIRVPDSILKEFRASRGLGFDQQDEEANEIWLKAIDELCLDWFLRGDAVIRDLRRAVGLPPEPDSDAVDNIHSQMKEAEVIQK